MKWFYAVGDRIVGPIDRSELEKLFETGAISTSTLVLQEGMYDWFPYQDLKKTTQFIVTRFDTSKFSKH